MPQSVLWMVGAGGGQYSEKVLVGQDERVESTPLLDPGGLPAKGRERESRKGWVVGDRVYVCLPSRSYRVADMPLGVLEVSTALLWPMCLIRIPKGWGLRK